MPIQRADGSALTRAAVRSSRSTGTDGGGTRSLRARSRECSYAFGFVTDRDPAARRLPNPWVKPDRNAVILAARDKPRRSVSLHSSRGEKHLRGSPVVQDLHSSGPLWVGTAGPPRRLSGGHEWAVEGSMPPPGPSRVPAVLQTPTGAEHLSSLTWRRAYRCPRRRTGNHGNGGDEVAVPTG
jgi:hypothetical protein